MNSSTSPEAHLSRRVFLAAAVAVGAAGCLQIPGPPAAAAVSSEEPRPHNTLLGLL